MDGLCARTDTALPGATCVFLSDMDHFGPAWTGFPAMDRYDSVDVFFVLSALAFHRTATANRQARKLRMRPARKQRIADADDLAFEADVSRASRLILRRSRRAWRGSRRGGSSLASRCV